MKPEGWWKLAGVFALLALTAFAILWLRASGGLRSAPISSALIAKQASSTRTAAGASALPARAASAAAQNSGAQASPATLPAGRVSIDDGGGEREFEIAMDEVVRRDAAGRETSMMFPAQADLIALRKEWERVRAASGESVYLVAYEAGVAHTLANRRLVSSKIRVALEHGAAAPGVAGAVNVQRPGYAPDFAVVEMPDSFAALDQLAQVRTASGVKRADILLAKQQSRRTLPNDTLISSQWHLKNTGQSGGTAGIDVNVEPVWNYGGSGYRGAGIVVALVDDGLQTAHPDLAANVRTDIDHDWNDSTADDPNPASGDDNNHGTACAGNVAAVGNNSLGVCGTAPEAKIVGLRLIAASETDTEEAEAMAWDNNVIQIKSNSWGPDDGGSTVEGPGSLTKAALQTAVTSGRGGLGTIFMWAGGNGGDVGDNSNYDGYANSIYTIAVGAFSNKSTQSYYSEPGADIVITSPSSGDSSAGELDITTVDRTGTDGYNTSSGAAGNYCTDFGGTSSATPTAAGVVALMLQRNPNLGWRDVQEILIKSARKVNSSDSDWVTNSAGYHFNHKFGAGLIDAQAAVNLAATWTDLGAQVSAVSTQSGLSASIPNNNSTGVTRTFDLGAGNIRIEHVTVRLTINHTARGNLAITLTSPTGIASRLAEVHGDTNSNYSDWTFMTVHDWGESSTGTWTLKIADQSSTGNTTGGTLTAAELVVYGTAGNAAPVITAASISPASSAYSDQALTVGGITASDAEGDAITYSYQWQSSSDGLTFANASGQTSATLAAAAGDAGKSWRCVVTPNDGHSSGAAFTTAPVMVLTRPAASVTQGDAYSYACDLVLAGTSAAFTRAAIVNEFSQGPSGGTAEWVELLTLQAGSFRKWVFDDAVSDSALVTFADSAVWDDIPAGTLIVIYNGSSKDALLPADDTDPSDGTMVLASNNTTYFSGSWPSLSNSGDALLLKNSSGTIVHQLGYGSNTTYTPNVGAVGSATAAAFTAGTEDAAATTAGWRTNSSTIAGSTTTTGVTPGAANTTSDATFVSNLRSGYYSTPALYRFGAGSQTPAGLSIDATTGLVSGTVTANSGDYGLVIERYNASTTVSMSYTLTVTAAPTPTPTPSPSPSPGPSATPTPGATATPTPSPARPSIKVQGAIKVAGWVATIRGSVVGAAPMRVVAATRAQTVEVSATSSLRYTLRVKLVVGRNLVTLWSRDRNGNLSAPKKLIITVR